MDHRRIQAGAGTPALVVAILLGVLDGRAPAGLLAADSYTIGSDPTAGQYQAGSYLATEPSNLTTLGFANGGYNGGGTASSQFGITTGGLTNPLVQTPPGTDGKVTVTGSAIGSGYKAVARSLTPVPASAGSTFFFSMLIQSDGVASVAGGGWVLAGFGNAVQPLPGATSGYMQGLYFGFAQDTGNPNDTGDLIMRYRTYDPSAPKTSSDAILIDGSQTNTTNQTYLVVAELNGNSNGSIDNVTWWVNPTESDSTADMTATALATGSLNTYAFQTTADFARLTYAETNWNVGADFDEIKMGTTLADVLPAIVVPEPGSSTLLGLGLVVGLGGAARRGARRR